MTILITGGAGFVGSHAAEYFAKKEDVLVFDNISRERLLKKKIKGKLYNWNFLKKLKNIRLIRGDITNQNQIIKATAGVDVIIHTAAQTAVTTSITDPLTDFRVNAVGTFNVLEAARKNDVSVVLYCSTNKVYGENVNKIRILEGKKRYFFEKRYRKGVPETLSIDLSKHTPYGCSKLSGDIYTQDYAQLYGIRTGVFRMSCIYGTRQFGVEDQGWVAWFTIATILGKPLTIYGNGKQVRDVLYVSDLIELYDKFIKSKLKHGTFNVGGGPTNTLSLLELIDLLYELVGKKSKIKFSNWRPSDQRVYISNIENVNKALGWKPKINPKEGVKKLVDWINKNRNLF